MPYSLSKEDYDVCKFVLYIICLPIITIAGLTGNSYSLYILRGNPTNLAFCTYLKALTCSDTLLLACAFVRSLLHGLEEADVPSAHHVNVYGEYTAGILFGSAFQRLSSSLIAVIAIERVLVVVYPLRVRSMFIETRPVRIVAALVVFFTLLQLPTFTLIKVGEMALNHSTNVTTHMLTRTEFARSQPEFALAYLFSLAILGIALPLLIVIVSTATILIRVKMQIKVVASRRVTGGSIETERMTLTLITMAMFFTLLSVPAVIIYVWSAYDRSPETMYLRALFTDIDIILVCLNSACDFVIYCLASNKFRAQFVQQVCGIVRKPRTSTPETSTGTSQSTIRSIQLNMDRNSTSSSGWVETGIETPSCLPKSPNLG